MKQLERYSRYLLGNVQLLFFVLIAENLVKSTNEKLYYSLVCKFKRHVNYDSSYVSEFRIAFGEKNSVGRTGCTVTHQVFTIINWRHLQVFHPARKVVNIVHKLLPVAQNK